MFSSCLPLFKNWLLSNSPSIFFPSIFFLFYYTTDMSSTTIVIQLLYFFSILSTLFFLSIPSPNSCWHVNLFFCFLCPYYLPSILQPTSSLYVVGNLHLWGEISFASFILSWHQFIVHSHCMSFLLSVLSLMSYIVHLWRTLEIVNRPIFKIAIYP